MSGALALLPFLALLQAATEQSNEARNGDLYAVQISVDDPARLDSEWAVTTPGAKISTTSIAHRNKPIIVAVIFTGCAADSDGKCDLTADYAVIDPTGKAYADQRNVEMWRAPQPGKGTLVMGAGRLGIQIENGEALGDYRVRATIHDKVAGRDLVTEQIIHVVEAP